jgi:hypothetical protein
MNIARPILLCTVAAPWLAAGEPAPTPPKSEPPRFDELVRDDFFAGDPASLDRGMAKCLEALKIDPHNADALAWEGTGWIARATSAADRAQAKALEDRGLSEINYAVALEPRRISTLIVRAATLLGMIQTSRPPALARSYTQQAMTDYELVLELEKPWFETEPEHGRGELLMALGEGWARLGNHDKATTYFKRVVHELPGTSRAQVAQRWLAGRTNETTKFTCLGCHTR